MARLRTRRSSELFSGLPKRFGSDRVEAERLDETLEFLEECVREAVAGQTSRLELTDVERLELEQGLLRDLGEFVRGEARSEMPLVPRRFEVSFGSERSAPELKAGLDLGGFAVSGKIDRVDLDPFSARGIVQDYKSGKGAHSAAKIESELRLQIPLYMLVLRDLLGVEPVGGLYRALAGERSARGVLRASARDDLVPGFAPRDYLEDEAFWALVDQAADRARGFVGADPRGTRRARPEGRIVPVVVRARPHLPGEAPVSTVVEPQAPNPEQAVAIDAGGTVFVSAGAGTGKTTVIVERFVRAVARGVDVGSILVVTFTERAAGELRSRIRARLLQAGRADLARELDGAWISTIHGFCHRLLRAYPAAAGVDPRFRVLDESQASVLRAEAFDVALAEFCSGEHPERVKLLATYGAGGLRRMLGGVAATLRAAGRPLELGLQEEPDLDKRKAELKAAAEAALAETDGESDADERAILARVVQLLEGGPHVDLLLDLSEIAIKGRGKERFVAYEDLRLALEQTALNVAAVRDRDLLQELLELFADAYQRAKDAESALDFEDLQLRARDVLSHDEAVRGSERLRFRSIMVDEFQDTNRLQCEIVDQFDPEELFFVGDEFQSIYRFRHADVAVFRERRAGSEGVLPLRANYRSRPELLDVVNELFAPDFGEDYEPLVAAGRFPDPAKGPAVELLVNDKQSYKETRSDWRRGEARAAARRVRELCDAGEATPGEIVFLFAAGTDAEVFEEELHAVGLPTYRAAGRGYFAQQQVLDVLSYLRLLHNRYDDEALAAVLASPLVGVSNDALCCCDVRRAVGRSSPASSGSCRRACPRATSSSSVHFDSGTTGSSRYRRRPVSSG